MPPPGTPMDVQMRAARAGLYRTPFERFERAVRSQSAAALGAGGFDPARDILAMTINRWGHGYALPVNTLFEDATTPPRFEIARRRFGRIAIANSDASGVDTIETAFNEAARAVRDLDRRDGGRNAVI
jgi:spermidine dehydrogenase